MSAARAAEIASKSPPDVSGTKEMVIHTRDHTVADSARHIATWQTGTLQSLDMMAVYSARAEGREREFDDLLKARRGLA